MSWAVRANVKECLWRVLMEDEETELALKRFLLSWFWGLRFFSTCGLIRKRNPQWKKLLRLFLNDCLEFFSNYVCQICCGLWNFWTKYTIEGFILKSLKSLLCSYLGATGCKVYGSFHGKLDLSLNGSCGYLFLKLTFHLLDPFT